MKKVAFILTACFLTAITAYAQENHDFYQPRRTTFWSDVQFGGGLGLGFGSGYTNISVSPIAVKPITEQFSAGAGLQFSYLKSKDFYESTSYGINLLGMYNPVEFLQFSAELEQLRVNNTWFDYTDPSYNRASYKKDFWNTALFLGLGYTSGNATIGVRYNVLFNKSDLVYNQAWMPFIRVYF